jgi:RHS repeat-associated protein
MADTDVTNRAGPTVGTEKANAMARMRVDRDGLLKEKEELKKELAETDDPEERRQIQEDINEIDQELADLNQEMGDLEKYQGDMNKFEEMQAAKEILRDEISRQKDLLNNNRYDPVTGLTNRTTRPEYIASLESRLADLEAGRTRSWGKSADDIVVDAMEGLVIPEGLTDVLPPLKWYRRGRRLAKAAKKKDEILKRLRGRREERIRNKGKRKKRKDDRCPVNGKNKTRKSNPVLVTTGLPVQADPSFTLSGLVPIFIGSIYDPEFSVPSAFGNSRVSDLDSTISVDLNDELVYLDESGFPVNFKRPVPRPGLWEEGDTTRGLKLAAAESRKLILKEERFFTHFKKYKDGIWRILHVEDRNGNRLVHERNAEGRLERLTTPEGLAVSFAYDNRGLRTSATLHGADGSARKIMQWEYDQAGNMTLVRSIYGQSVQYSYESDNLRTGAHHSNGYAAEHRYDDKGRVVGVSTNGPFNGDRFEYDDELKITTYLPGGDESKLEKFYLDADNTVSAEANSLGHIKRTIYDEFGYVAAEIDAEGNGTSFRHDGDGNIKTITDGEGRETFFYWNEDGQIEITIDDEANSWDYEYDEKGNLVSITDPLKFRTDIRNDEYGRPIGIMRHDGLIESRKYDERGNLVALTDYRGGKTVFEYDGFNRIIAITDPLEHTTKFEYEDQPGFDFMQPSRIMRPDGVVRSTVFNQSSGETRVTDGEGRVTVYKHGYGPNNLLTEVRDPLGGTLKFRYDGLERLSTVENQKGLHWTFERDSAGRVVRETDFDKITIEYTHDAADRIVDASYSDGARHSYIYDKSNLLIREDLLEPGNDRAQMIRASNQDATVTFERDALGRIISETVNGRRVESVYDCCGNRTARKIGDRLVNYAYDPLGALKQIVIGTFAPLDFERDAIGQELSRKSSRGFALTQTWDAVGQLEGQKAGRAPSAQRIALPQETALRVGPAVQRAYQWSKALEPVAISDTTFGSMQYGYDGNGQVQETRFGDGSGERFDYDKALNVAGSGGSDAGRFAQWLKSPGGRVEESLGPNGERVRLQWDARGRVTSRTVERNGFRPKVWQYEWDGKDRLTGCVTPDNRRFSYGYDPFGRRLWKVNLTATASRPVSHSDRLSVPEWQSGGMAYLWDGDVIAEEIPLGIDGTPQFDRAVSWHFEPGTFRPLAKEEPKDRLTYVVTDHLGTPRELFGEAGEAVWAAEYHTWGTMRRVWIGEGANDNAPVMHPGDARVWTASTRAPANDSGPGGASGRWFSQGNLALKAEEPETLAATQYCPIRFQGQLEDEETGLSNNRYRSYDPLSGQYMSMDPIGLLGGTRSSGYVPNPILFVDPMGLYGVYIFQVGSGGKCYVGRGDTIRMQASKRARSGGKPLKCIRDKHHNTDADAAAAGVNPVEYGKLVENRLIEGFGANTSPAWMNEKLDGQKAWAAATPAQRVAASATAAGIKAGFGTC